MEVFVAFTKDDEYQLLEDTLVAWGECDGAEPIAIQVPRGKKYEIRRRVVSDSLAKGSFYVVAELGLVPVEKDVIRSIERSDKCALNLLSPLGRVYVGQKGSVARWVTPESESYNREHMESVKLSGGKVQSWADIAYKPLREC
jgi:hypothetical protein